MVRKVPFDQKLITLIVGPLLAIPDESINRKEIESTITGISELLFEVAYGAGEGLHSKAKEVIS